MNSAYAAWMAVAFTAPAVIVYAESPSPQGNMQEARASMNEAITLLQNLNDILDTIHDNSSANAAAMKMVGNLTEYATVIEELDIRVDNLDPAQQRALEQAKEARFDLLKSSAYEKIQALDAAGAYGSPALQSAISLYRQSYK